MVRVKCIGLRLGLAPLSPTHGPRSASFAGLQSPPRGTDRVRVRFRGTVAVDGAEHRECSSEEVAGEGEGAGMRIAVVDAEWQLVASC